MKKVLTLIVGAMLSIGSVAAASEINSEGSPLGPFQKLSLRGSVPREGAGAPHHGAAVVVRRGPFSEPGAIDEKTAGTYLLESGLCSGVCGLNQQQIKWLLSHDFSRYPNLTALKARVYWKAREWRARTHF